MTFKTKFAWVWYSMTYSWNSSFTNHLKFRWYHYAFCKGRAKVFRPMLYLGEWKNDIRKILEKHPNQIISSHGLYALLMLIEKQQIEKIMAFLENENVDLAIEKMLQELNDPIIANLGNLETLSSGEIVSETKTIIADSDDQEEIVDISNGLSEDNGPSNQRRTPAIHARTCVIALDIYYDLHGTRAEYNLLKKSPSKFEATVRHRFNIENLAFSLYRHVNFDYRVVLKKPIGKEKSQLKKQFKQIIANPDIFKEAVVKRAKQIYSAHFR